MFLAEDEEMDEKTTVWYIDKLEEKFGWTDYRVAKVLNISHASISRYRNGKGVMDDYVATKIAGFLEVSPMEIICLANYEREKNVEKKKFWKSYFNKVATVFFTLGLIGILSSIGGDFQSTEGRKDIKITSFFMVSAIIVLFYYLT